MAALRVGERLETPGRTIGESDVNLFAGLTSDFTPIHVDAQFAATTPFGERIAHGMLVMSVAIGLLTQTGVLGPRVVGMLNVNWDFSATVKLGDTIHALVEVTELRPTSKPGRSVACFAFEVFNQRDEMVQRGQMLVLVRMED